MHFFSETATFQNRKNNHFLKSMKKMHYSRAKLSTQNLPEQGAPPTFCTNIFWLSFWFRSIFFNNTHHHGVCPLSTLAICISLENKGINILQYGVRICEHPCQPRLLGWEAKSSIISLDVISEKNCLALFEVTEVKKTKIRNLDLIFDTTSV